MKPKAGAAAPPKAREGCVPPSPHVPADTPIYTLFDESSGPCRQKIAGALLDLANSWTIGELRERLAVARVTGDRRDEAVDVSVAAMQYWNSVLGVAFDATAAHHAAGFKPEDFARLVVDGVSFGVATGAFTAAAIKK